MQVDVTTRITNYHGEVLKEGEQEVELRTVLINALNYEDPKLSTSPHKKMRAFVLSQEIMKAEKDVELKADDIVYIKERLMLIASTMIYGQTIQLLGE